MWMRVFKYGCMGSLLAGRLAQHGSQQGQPACVDTPVYSVCEWLQVAESLGWLRLTDHCSVNSLLLQLHRLTGSPTLAWHWRVGSSCSVMASSSDSSIKRLSDSGASLKHAAMMVNDSKAVSCTVPIFAWNEADPFPGIREWKMSGIHGRPGNGSPGMHSLVVGGD